MDFEEFFEDEYGRVLRTVALVVGDRGRAEDVTQEAFARAYRSWARVSRLDRPAAWVHVVAINESRKRFRRSVREASTPATAAGTATDPSGGVVTRALVAELIATLPERQRATVVLRYLGDLSIAEIADALGCARGTVKSNLHDALRNLRVEIARSEP